MDAAVARRMSKLKKLADHPLTPAGEAEAARARLRDMEERYGVAEPPRFATGGRIRFEYDPVKMAEAMRAAGAAAASAGVTAAQMAEAVNRMEQGMRRRAEEAQQRHVLDLRAIKAVHWLNRETGFHVEQNHRLSPTTLWLIFEAGEQVEHPMTSEQIIDFAQNLGWRGVGEAPAS